MYLFIVNPMSGKGKGKYVWKAVQQELIKRGIPYYYAFTDGPEDAIKQIQEAMMHFIPSEIKGIVAVGGDGTIHEVVNGILQTGEDFPLGVIPAGTGNDFARAFGLNDWKTSLEILLEGNLMLIDLGKVNETYYFINSVGAGFDGEVAYHSNQSKHKKLLNRLNLGKLIYILMVCKCLFTYKRRRLVITSDNWEKMWEKVWFVAVGNIPYYGGGMKICPDANPRDSQFQVCVVHGISPLHLLFVFPKVFKGQHKKYRAVDFIDLKDMSLQFDQAVRFHMDGEVKGKSSVNVRMIPNGLRVITKGATNE